MAELSLYLTNVNVSLGQGMDTEKSSTVEKEYENVELGDLGKKKPKIPRRTIYFASGETMEEYSTDEEEEEEPEKAKTLSKGDPVSMLKSFQFHTKTKMASLLGITTPKYQYAIDEYYRMKKEEEEEEEENRLSEEAERRFEEQHNQDGQQPKIEQPEGTASFVNVTFELEQESHAIPDANKVPAPIPS
uniref:Family with sequence similarity 177 member A1 n=1 Tax=Cyprinus carpio TaxID=7962 RepID=A0A8C1IT77_CYPCA